MNLSWRNGTDRRGTGSKELVREEQVAARVFEESSLKHGRGLTLDRPNFGQRLGSQIRDLKWPSYELFGLSLR